MLNKMQEKICCQKGLGELGQIIVFVIIACFLVYYAQNSYNTRVGEYYLRDFSEDISLIQKNLDKKDDELQEKNPQFLLMKQFQAAQMGISNLIVVINNKIIPVMPTKLKSQLEAKNKELELLNSKMSESINILSSPNLTPEQLNSIKKNKYEIIVTLTLLSVDFNELYMKAILN